MSNNLSKSRGVLRKAVALLSGVAVLFSLAACGSANAGESSDAKSDASSSASALEQVKSAGKIVFATEGTYAPFSYHDSKTNELTGYDVEVAKAIAKEVGVKAEFAEGSFDSLLAGVDAKKYDTVADQISATDERKAKYDFTEPYTYSYGVVVTTKDNPKGVKSFDDVKGLQAAETGTSNWNKTAQEKGATIVQVNDFGQAVEALQSGRADVTLNDGLAVLDYLKQKPDANIKIAAKSEKTPAAQLPFRKGSDDLVKAVNDAIAKLQQDGTLTKISEKYFGEDFSQE
ncbi:amino acid ABC transporter substrate-binding protein [Bifidobacterium myosotis]|uniref:Amino acid ABC transporter substrate-binding protein n=1 Tax=Bifidobacterium myosotis TaxID=1630166 RepID=A0A261FJY2_9BIFI|nr:transporter substrate-binding domain-containing protein [Bifidobacterium myosotis]KAA8829455.1 transporter substrate-binding domain-containing protein [Bifidobacterium myosotis]OZG59477.1 amino acid ABC transporter substrate-binding protein [Bifidobacterium myosotis]